MAAEYHHPAEKERLQIFDSLIKDVTELHIFSETTEKNLNYNWQEHISEYRQWFIKAKNKRELLSAVDRLQNSLHNTHCRIRVPEKADWLTLGIDTSYQNNEKCPFYVSDIRSNEIAKRISTGDCIKTIDGISVGDFLAQNFNIAPENNWFYLNRAIADYVSNRRADKHYIPDSGKSMIELESRKTGKRVNLELPWGKKETGDNVGNSESDINYASHTCADMPVRQYSHGYTAIKEANNFCIYVSSDSIFANYPIVRFFSFDYGEDRFVKNDFRILKDFLAQQDFKGFVLDLRDNPGGNNPNWFIEWFTDLPYYDRFVRLKFNTRLADSKILSECMMGGQKTQWYLHEWKNRQGAQQLTSFRPFFCKTDTCLWDNKYYPKNTVSKLPFAILTGFDCHSSCDSFVYHFLTKHLAVGVGERGRGGYTSHRLPLEIHNPADGSTLAYFSLAVSEDYDGDTKQPIEGFSPMPDKEMILAFENQEIYDSSLVFAAIDLIRARKK